METDTRGTRGVQCHECGALTSAIDGVYKHHYPTTLAIKVCITSGKPVNEIVGKAKQTESQWNALFERK